MENKETLEEVMNKDGYHESDYDKIWREGVQLGVKWQAERMYSEEEVIELLNKREDCINQTSSVFDYTSAKEWFKQFKKK
jgi:hypothetical protein